MQLTKLGTKLIINTLVQQQCYTATDKHAHISLSWTKLSNTCWRIHFDLYIHRTHADTIFHNQHSRNMSPSCFGRMAEGRGTACVMAVGRGGVNS